MTMAASTRWPASSRSDAPPDDRASRRRHRARDRREQSVAVVRRARVPAERPSDAQQRRHLGSRADREQRRRRADLYASFVEESRCKGDELDRYILARAPRCGQLLEHGRTATGPYRYRETRMRPRQPDPEPKIRSSSLRVSKHGQTGRIGEQRVAPEHVEAGSRQPPEITPTRRPSSAISARAPGLR